MTNVYKEFSDKGAFTPKKKSHTKPVVKTTENKKIKKFHGGNELYDNLNIDG